MNFDGLIKLITDLADRVGSKCLLAILGILSLLFLAQAEAIPGEWAAGGIVVVEVAYFFFRSRQEEREARERVALMQIGNEQPAGPKTDGGEQ